MPVIINGSTGISGTDGSAGTPAVQGTDTNTGMFFPAADTIAFAEGGVEVMRIDSSGNVGIGTTAPGAALDVGGASFIRNTRYGADSAYVQRRANGTISSPTASLIGETQLIRFDYYDGASFIPAAQISAVVDGTPGTNDMPGRLVFSTTADGAATLTERMRITASGDLQFNSGYGSVATAYGCRAWVNFNGTGTVAIRASGNVSSITDNGTGDYTVNFTTAMPDANYCVTMACSAAAAANVYPVYFGREVSASSAPVAGSFRCWVKNSANSLQDLEYVSFAIFR